jgi:outer membrane murein-binding lipoprotein Lpp
MALMPLVAICGAVALQLADARYMVRDVDGESVEQQIETVQTAVTDIQAKQQVFTSEIEHIKASVQDVKEDTAEINRKLDRLIERQR